MTLTLIHAPQSRSSGALWLLEELGVPYETKIVSIRRGNGEGTLDPANPHPHGKVPAIIHDGTLVYERAAITLYLTDAFPKSGIGPQIGDKARGSYLTWLAYYTGVVEPAFLSKFMNYEVPRGTAGWVVVEEVMEHINNTLITRDYLVHDAFTAADILYAGAFHQFWNSPTFTKTDALKAYVDRCVARPACARAVQKDSGPG